LVPSWRQAAEWEDEADETVSTGEAISEVTGRLTRGHVGLVVIVNRYDGVDLPDEACRLLIIDSLPFAYSGIERREAVALRDSEAMVTRQLQRLEQGMGRGVRSRDDRCAVLLLGPRLTQLVARADVADRLSAATRAQLDLSRRGGALVKTAASNLAPAGLSELRLRGARPAGPPPAAAAAPNSRLPAGAVTEVDRTAGSSGVLTLAGTRLALGTSFARQRVTLRIDGHLLHPIRGGVPAKTLPSPADPAQRGRLRGACLATGPLPPRQPARSAPSGASPNKA
jgi:hypothetical protein